MSYNRDGYICPACTHYGVPEDCYHSEKEWKLAYALASHVDEGPVDLNTDYGVEKTGGFLEDAESLLLHVGEDGPWEISDLEPIRDRYDFAYLINGVVCVVPTCSGCKEAPYAEPVARISVARAAGSPDTRGSE